MNKKLKLIAITGLTGSGKSIAAKFFRDKGMPVLRFGDQTDLGLQELGMEINEKNERWYREKIRQELGMAVYAIKIKPRIEEAAKTYNLIVLDGLYSWEEYIYLNKIYPQLQILCIYTTPKIRYGRLRKRTTRPLTDKEAHTRDISEIEKLNKGGTIVMADYLIKNDSSLADFHKELEDYYHTI